MKLKHISSADREPEAYSRAASPISSVDTEPAAYSRAASPVSYHTALEQAFQNSSLRVENDPTNVFLELLTGKRKEGAYYATSLVAFKAICSAASSGDDERFSNICSKVELLLNKFLEMSNEGVGNFSDAIKAEIEKKIVAESSVPFYFKLADNRSDNKLKLSHAIALNLSKASNGNIRLDIYNSGLGLDFHNSQFVNGKKKYFTKVISVFCSKLR